MIIKSVYIKEFGSICDREIILSDGLNIIEGDNESGKSTLLSFIKFMLYGLQKKVAGEVVSEKERAFSWQNGIAAGNMTVQTENGTFRIERSAKASSRSESAKIFDTETGEQVHAGENPGELFFGLPLNVFESTACVRQLKCTQIDGSGLGTSIENLMVAADENTSVKKALQKLDSVRKKLMHKTGRGGEIADIEDRVLALQTRMNRAGERSKHLEIKEASLEGADKIIAEARATLEEERALSRAYEARQILIRFDALRSAEKRVEALKKQEKETLDGGRFGGRLPDSSEIATLSELRAGYVQAKESRRRSEEGIEELKRQRVPEDDIDRCARQMNTDGGERAVLESYSVAWKKSKNARKTGAVLVILTVIFALVGAVFATTVSFLPTLIKLSKTAKIICTAVAFLLCVFGVALGISCFVRSKKLEKECDRITQDYGCEDYSREALVIRLAALRHRISERESFEAMVCRLRDGIGEAIGAEKSAEERLARHFASLCSDEIPDDSELAERSAQLVDEYSAFAEKVGEIRRDIDKYTALVTERRAELSAYNEAEIRSGVTPEIEEKLAGVNITMLRRDIDFQQARLESAMQKKQSAEREMITLQATSEDPEKLALELEEQKKLLSSRQFMHDSLTLATESIAQASEAVRRNVTPRLRRYAGELLGKLTDGRYTEIAISPDFKISVPADGETRPVEALSSGTRDAVYLAVRLALVSVLYKNEKPTLLLDEILSQIDDTRAKNILQMLSEYAKNGTQCLLFTCHSRESAMSDAPSVKM